MTGYLLRRTGQIVVTLFLIITLAFFLIQAQPGDFASFYTLDPKLTKEFRQEVRENFGLNKPLWEQYGIHIKNIVTGNFGISFSHQSRSVLDVILERLPRTALLFFSATIVSFYLGFLLGKSIAWRRGGLLEYTATISGTALFTVFTPWFALMMIWVFAFKLDWFPIGKFSDTLTWLDAPVSTNHVFNSMLLTAAAFSLFLFMAILVARKVRPRGQGWVFFLVIAVAAAMIPVAWKLSGIGFLALDILEHMVLPIVTLALVSFAGTMLLTRNSMLETLREDFVMAARAKGLSERAVRDRHAARNALLPVVTSLVYSVAFAIDGSVIIETIFSWEGTGLLLLEGAQNQDLPLVLGSFVFIGILALVAHLVADLLYAYLDPRIRYQ